MQQSYRTTDLTMEGFLLSGKPNRTFWKSSHVIEGR